MSGRSDVGGPAPIGHISIKGLFGYLSYEISLPAVGPDHDRALILYGDNGSGKTTILQSVYSLLSSAPNRGHRTRLGRIPFERVAVEFRDGREVVAERPRAEGQSDGSFNLRMQDGKGDRASAQWSPRSSGAIPSGGYVVVESEDGTVLRMEESGFASDAPTRKTKRQFDTFIERLAQVVPESIYFLQDDRSLGSDQLPPEEGPDEFRRRRYLEQTESSVVDQRTVALDTALRRARSWVRESTLRASEVGGQSANQIYVDVASRIASPSRADDPSTLVSPAQMRERLIRIGQRNESFVRLGLVGPTPAENLIASLESAPDSRIDALLSVLVPYADALQAQLDALETLRYAITTFLEQTEGFLRRKSVSFSVRSGFQVLSHVGEPLEPHQLSSGERQLLLLLTTVLATRDDPAVYLIDEPELSLNMKWQRRLVDSLLACSGGSNASFLMASHSFELMAAARECVFSLTSE